MGVTNILPPSLAATDMPHYSSPIIIVLSAVAPLSPSSLTLSLSSTYMWQRWKDWHGCPIWGTCLTMILWQGQRGCLFNQVNIGVKQLLDADKHFIVEPACSDQFIGPFLSLILKHDWDIVKFILVCLPSPMSVFPIYQFLLNPPASVTISKNC